MSSAFVLIREMVLRFFRNSERFRFRWQVNFEHSRCNRFIRIVRMATEDMYLNVSLSSIHSQKGWCQRARLLVSWRVRVMDTELNTNKLKWMIRVAQTPES